MKKKSLLKRKKEFWKKFEDSILEVIQIALEFLVEENDLPKHEDELNRKFYNCLVKANYELQKSNRGRESPPIYEARNQPFHDDSERVAREHKIPDFQWSITDVTEIDPGKSSKQFVLECKRLGKPVGSWVLNRNYVTNGIKRFVSLEHGYARGMQSSAMLGYVQSMEIHEVLSEVNVYVKEIAQPILDKSSSEKMAIFLSHEVKMQYCEDSLKLKHIWIDLKNNYQLPDDGD